MDNNFYGRIKLKTDILPTGNIKEDAKIIPQILQKVYPLHQQNVITMNRLVDYFYNVTDIQNKETIARPDINNKISVPRANTTVITINSYCFSNPFKFISLQAEENIVEELKEFNDCCELDNYAANLLDCTQWSGITGIGYKFVDKPTQEDIEAGRFFKTVTDIDPRYAFCVYSNDLKKEKVLGVILCDKTEVGKNGVEIAYTEFNVFTKWHQWRFKSEATNNVFSLVPFDIFINGISTSVPAYPVLQYDSVGNNVVAKESIIPLIEYVRHPDRTNDFEKQMILMDAINVVLSSSVDAVEENSDYVFKFKNVDVGEFDGNGKNPVLETIQKALQLHILPINGIDGIGEGAQPDASILEVPLNQNEVRQLLEYLTEQLEESLFVPNRNTSSGGADTNSSVETRNGFRSLEDIAGIITAQTIKSEKEFISCALKIAQQYNECPFKNLKAKDIGIKPMRNKIESLINSTQAFATMINAGVNRITAYVVSGLVADATDTAKMDKLERDERFQEQVNQEIERLKIQQKYNNTDTQNNSSETKEETNGNNS